jgi:hypothetical protein
MSCNSKPKTNCKPYFEFDAIEHYSIKISFEDEMRLMERDSLSLDELKLNDVLFQRKPARLVDSSLLLNLQKIGFVKRIINASSFEAINTIFCERKHKESLATSCIAVYRDVLIFKKQDKIIGTAKICFDCWYHVIAGTSVNTDDFGQSGDYEKLQKLLYEKSKAED